MIKEIPIADIKIGDRPRKDLGDLQVLADSIAELSLLQPIGVTSDNDLVWGERRLKACQRLGWTTIHAVVDPTFDDILQAAKAERGENVCRKPFSHTEAVAKGKQIERIERERAQQRKGGRPRKTGGKLPPVSKAKTRERVAAAVGLSGRTYDKAKLVVETGSDDLVEALDDGRVSVDAAAHLLYLPAAEQGRVIDKGNGCIANTVAQIKQRCKDERQVKALQDNPCDVIIQRWIKTIHDALVPVNSVRRDLGGGKEWARNFNRENLLKMANELEFVIGLYQEWLTQIKEVIDEADQ